MSSLSPPDEDAGRARLASALRHDLRGCSRRISSLGAVLAQRLPPEASEAAELLELIEVNAKRGSAIADGLAKLVALSPRDGSQRTDLRAWLQRALSIREGWTTSPDRLQAPDNERLDAIGQPGLVDAALTPILDNAERYGHGTRIVTCLRDGGGILVDVTSGGDPMTHEYLDHILRPMQRGHGAEETAAGLGLSLSARAVDLLGGTLSLSPAAGGGLTCRIHLPSA